MIDDDIRLLVQRDRSADLGRLGADIWRREAMLQSRRRAMRRMAAWQGAVMAVAVAGSAGAGFAYSVHPGGALHPSLTMPGERLAPSTLLFGARR
jgi:hypothetical protein